MPAISTRDQPAALWRGVTGEVGGEKRAGGLAKTILIFLAAFAIAAVPIAAVEFPPLRDYYNHLARMPILADGGRDAFFAEHYRTDWSPIGALAIDLIMPGLLSVFGLAATGKLFLLAMLALLASGVVALHRTLFRGFAVWPFLSFLLLYNGILIWGFINYLFAIGLFLWVLAAWFRTGGWSPWLRIPVFTLLAYGLMLAHFYSFCLYAVCVAGAELTDHWRERKSLAVWRNSKLYVGAAQFAAPAALFVLLSPTAGDVLKTGLFSISIKLHAVASMVHTYDYALDHAIGLTAIGLYLLAADRRWIVVHPKMQLALAGFGLLFLIMPNAILGSSFADFRLPAAIAFVAVASARPAVRDSAVAPSQRRVRIPDVAFAMLLFAGLAGASTALTVKWRGFHQRYLDVFALADQVPIGKSLLLAIAQGDLYNDPNAPPICYAALLEIPQRKIFVNGLFVQPIDNAPLFLTDKYRWLSLDPSWAPEYFNDDLALIKPAPETSPRSPFRPAVLDAYDYLLVRGEAAFGVAPESLGRKLDQRGDLALYDLAARPR